jgi:septal ring-binding cell division protein DamX
VVTRPPATPPPPTPPASVNVLEQARTALRGGNYAEAARAFATHIRRAPRGTATVQLLVACSTDTVQKAMSEVGSSELFILPVNYQGRDCYRMCWGLYADAARAASAVRSLPDYFRRGGASPRVVTATEVLP